MRMHTPVQRHGRRDLLAHVPWHQAEEKQFLRRHPIATAALGTLTIGATARLLRSKGRFGSCADDGAGPEQTVTDA
jgi:hypothetical protein